MSKSLQSLTTQALAELKRSPLVDLKVQRQPQLQRVSVFDAMSSELKTSILTLTDQKIAEDPSLARAVGSMVGMAVADSIGHNFEFMPVRDQVGRSDSYFEYPSSKPGGTVHGELNRFQLKPGQWTDDTSMGLCMADSLLLCGQYDGSSIRTWFFNWWNNGLDNAFRLDNRVGSVGLGGNIANSLREIGWYAQRGQAIPPRFGSNQEDAGNGSLMRLAPVVLRYHTDIKTARELAYESSLSTHPGKMAAEACALMAHILVRAMHRPADSKQTAAEFLDEVKDEYLELLGDCKNDSSKTAIKRVLLSNEKPSSTECCWNWRSPTLGVERVLRNRGNTYNGYPVSPGYFGAFSLDGLAMSLHCMYTTSNFNEALVKIVNMRGDADTTGSICCQMAGAFYGVQAIDEVWCQQLKRWDNGEITLRAALLHTMASN